MVDMPGDQSSNEPCDGDDASEGTWFAFVRQNEEVGFQIIRVNMNLYADEIEPEKYPVASIVTVPYADGVDWPESQDEWTRLDDVEDQLVDRVSSDFLFAGVLSAGYSRDFVFFGPRALQRDQLECDSVGDVLVIDDPDWEVYSRKLLPTRDESRRAQDDGVIRAVSEHGDQNELPRPVDHFLYFETEADADRCSEALESLQPTEISQRSPVPEEELEDHMLQVVFEQPLSQPAFSEFTARLEEIAESHNGSYDGWETPIAKPGDDSQ